MLKQLAGSSNISIYDIPKSTLFTGYASNQSDNMGVFGIFREQLNAHKDYYDKTKWTFSTWFKLAGNPTSGRQILLYSHYNNNNAHAPTVELVIHSDDNSMIFGFSNVGEFTDVASTQGILKTKMKFEDFGAWYHVVAVFDSTYPIKEERMKLYINGNRITDFDSLGAIGQDIPSFYPTQNTITALGCCNGEIVSNGIDGNSSVTDSRIELGFIGKMTNWIEAPLYSDMYMADTYLITGNVLNASDFGKFDPATNQWIPIKYDMGRITSPYAATSFRVNSNDDYNPADLYSTGTPFTLKFNMGNNANPIKDITQISYPNDVWTYKRFLDTPTNNVCCLNSNNRIGANTNLVSGFQVRNSNITDMGSNNGLPNKVQATMSIPSSGKWCFFGVMKQYSVGTDLFIGVVQSQFDMNTQTAFSGSLLMKNTGRIFEHNITNEMIGQTGFPIPWTDSSGNIYVGVFVNSDLNQVHFKYRTAEGGTYPTNVYTTNSFSLPSIFDRIELMPIVIGKGASFSFIATQFGEIPIAGHFDSWDKQGYKLITSKNLPAPRIKIPQKYFKSYTWIGNGASQQIGELQKPLDLYDSGKSVIFANNTSLTKSTLSPTNPLKWTFSTWFRNTNPTVTNNIFKATGAGGSSYTISIGIGGAYSGTNGIISFKAMSNSTTTQFAVELYGYSVQDCDWHHLTVSYDAVNSNLYILIDGHNKAYIMTQGTTFTNIPTFNQNNQLNTIGGNGVDIQLADLYFLDGISTIDASYCAVVDGNGYLVPKAFDSKNGSVTFGNNGFHFDWRTVTQSTPTSLGYPISGQGNSTAWTVNGNFSGYNFISKDSPANAFAIMDGDNKVSWNTTSKPYTLSCGNTIMGGYTDTTSNTFNFSEFHTTLKANTSNCYFEFLSETFNGNGIAQVIIWTKSYFTARRAYLNGLSGVQAWTFADTFAPNPLIAPTGDITQDFGMYALYFDDVNNNALPFGRYGICFDSKKGYIWAVSIAANGTGTWLNGKSPINNPNDPYTKIPIDPQEEYYVSGFVYRNHDLNSDIAKLSFNFGQFDYVYNSIPLGFPNLCENNVKEITTDQESPSLLWIKSRNLSLGCRIFNKGLNYVTNFENGIYGYSSYSMSEGSSLSTFQPEQVKNYNKNGFIVGNRTEVNSKNDSYVAWGWNEGAIPGMDITQFTSNNNNTPIPHSLGVTPKVVFTKMLNPVPNSNPTLVDASSLNVRSSLFNHWSTSLFMGGLWDEFSLNNNIIPLGEFPNSSNYYHNVPANYVGATCDAYMFTEVEGFSRFSTYVGNGANKFVYTGFRPAFILFKAMYMTLNGFNANIGSGWTILDSTRDKYNHHLSKIINPSRADHTENTIEAVFTTQDVYMFSNGFKLIQDNQNQNNWTYFYMAFAESPLKYSNAR